MKISLILLLLISIPLITAGLDEASLTIRVSNNSIEIIDSKFPNINNQNFTYSITNKSMSFTNTTFNLIYEINETASGFDFADEYTNCLTKKTECEILKKDIDRGWTECLSSLNRFEGQNATACDDLLDDCELDLERKKVDLESKAREIQDLSNDQEDTRNTKYIYFGAGLLVGVLGLLWKQGKIGNKHHEKSQDELNKQIAA